MTRTAIYSLQDNTLTEQPGPEPTKRFEDLKDYETELKEYRERLSKLRTIPCHESARSLWKDGQKLVDGKDYEVRKCTDPGNCLLEVACVTCKPVAFPLPVKSEDDLWRGLILENFNDTEHDYSDEYIDMKIVELKKLYSLTKR